MEGQTKKKDDESVYIDNLIHKEKKRRHVRTYQKTKIKKIMKLSNKVMSIRSPELLVSN